MRGYMYIYYIYKGREMNTAQKSKLVEERWGARAKAAVA